MCNYKNLQQGENNNVNNPKKFNKRKTKTVDEQNLGLIASKHKKENNDGIFKLSNI